MYNTRLGLVVLVGLHALLSPLGQPLAQPAKSCVEEHNENYRLTFANGTSRITTPGVARVELPVRNSVPDYGKVHVLVQLCESASKESLAKIGIDLVSRYQATTYTAAIPGALVERLAHDGSLSELSSSSSAAERNAANQMRWIGTIAPDLKLASALRTGNISRRGLNADGTLRLRVQFYQGVTRDQAETVLASVGIQKSDLKQLTDDVWRINLARSKLSDLASENLVRSIDQGAPRFAPTNDTARTAVGIDEVQAGSNPPNYTGLTGQGVTVAVMDFPVDIRHDDFWQHDEFGHRTKLRFVHHGGELLAEHGTHVAGIIGGNGHRSNKSTSPTLQFPTVVSNAGLAYQWRGVAPQATLGSFEIGEDDVGSIEDYYDAFVLFDAAVSNNSYVQNCAEYDFTAQMVDGVMHGSKEWSGVLLPRRTIVWSAGNNGLFTRRCDFASGYFSILASAKNPIVVGGVNADHTMWPDSSLGPTPDGRLKPDVVAPACMKSTVTEDLTFDTGARVNGYFMDCGTSMSSAVVSGIAALILEQWNQSYCASTYCQSGSSVVQNPLPSTVKAVLIQSAADLIDETGSYANDDTGWNSVMYFRGPDYVTGYGVVNAEAARAIIAAGPGLDRLIVESELASDSQTAEYFLNIPDTATDIKVTLAWDDEPSNSTLQQTTPKLVNDLDLALIDPNDKVFGPWVLPVIPPAMESGEYAPWLAESIDPADLRAERVGGDGAPLVDRHNNVEQVEVDSADMTPGIWTVRVTAHTDLDVAQTYSIAANHPLSLISPVTANAPILASNSRRESRCIELDWQASEDNLKLKLPGSVSCGYIPMEPLCRYAFDCSNCNASGYCPDISLQLTGMPTDVEVSIRNNQNKVINVDQSIDSERLLTWKPEDSKEHVVFFSGRGKKVIPEGTYAIGIEVAKAER